ncbi:MAG: zf-HC2 domain-containing protein [Gemmatimonadales bacterium]
MSHLDEGTLHALLDGELGSTELMEIEAHLGSCAACGSRLRDAREFLGEADRLVASVQFRRTAEGARPAAAAAVSPGAPPPPPPVPPSRPQPEEHRPWEDPSPVLLIPDNPESAPIMRRWPRRLGLAATIAVAVTAGYMASGIGKNPLANMAATAPRPTMLNDSLSLPSAPLASESDKLDAESKELTGDDAPAPSSKAAPAAAKPAPPAKQPQEKPRARDLASTASGAVRTDIAPVARSARSGSADDTADQHEEAATKAAEQDAIRLQAAQALNQLDRERRVNRAAAATAALDRAELERKATTAAPAVAAPPPPPTLEQRSQVYLRIGLDEASRQLGGPVHVIEGMSPVFMGLAPGRVAAGADTTRPVVRVVYQDPQGRMILLDQQRRAAQAPVPASSGAWSLGDITVGLQGEAPAEVLRSLRSRVR